MAQQYLTLLPFIALLLACCVTPSVQQAEERTYTLFPFPATNGTLISWPRIDFEVAGSPIDYPQIYVSTGAVMYANTTINIITEFFDVNTSKILWSESTLAFSYTSSATSNNEADVSERQVISPCLVAVWNPLNRWIGVRNIVFFSTTSVNITTLNQTIKIDNTLVRPGSERSISPTTYKTILIPAPSLNNNRSVFQLNGSLDSSFASQGIPFNSFCFNQQGSCSNTNCLAKDDIVAGSASKNFSVDSLQPSRVYYLSFHTPTDNSQYFLTLQMTEHEIPIITGSTTATGEGHRINGNLLNLLLPICTLVFIGALHW